MSTINEIPRVYQWLYTILNADATLTGLVNGRIYQEVAPQGSAYPAVIINRQAPIDDLETAGAHRVWSRGVFLVKAVNETNSYASLQSIADRIDAVLHAAQGGTADVAIDYCVRRRPFAMTDTPANGKIYKYLGGEYEIAVRYTP